MGGRFLCPWMPLRIALKAFDLGRISTFSRVTDLGDVWFKTLSVFTQRCIISLMIWWFDVVFHQISQIVIAKWRWKDGSPTSMSTAYFFHLFNQRVFSSFFGTVAARTPLQRPHLKRFVACRHSPRHLPSNSDGQMRWWTMVSIFFVYPLWHLDEAPGPETSLWQDALEPTKLWMDHIMELVWHEVYAYCRGDSDGKRRCMETSFGIMHWCAYTALPALATQGKSQTATFETITSRFDLKMLV